MEDAMLENMSCAGARSPAFFDLFEGVIEGNQARVDAASSICLAIKDAPPIPLAEAERVATPLIAGTEPSREVSGRAQ